jgi:hypothetical protein
VPLVCARPGAAALGPEAPDPCLTQM